MIIMMDSDDLRAAIKAIGVSKLAKKSGVKPTTLYSFLDGQTANLRADTRDKVVDALSNSESTDKPLSIAGEDYLPIPIYDIRAAAGHGSIVEDGSPIAHQIFRKQWLKSLNVQPELLAVIQVSGDSMADTIQHGDTVLVNRSIQRVVEEGIYIILFEGGLLIKRCQRNPLTGDMAIISDNKAYQTYTATAEQSHDLQVIGKVVWIGRQVA